MFYLCTVCKGHPLAVLELMVLSTWELRALSGNIIHDGVSFIVKYVTEFTILATVKFSDIR